MNRNANKPWPHSPAIIARVEIYPAPGEKTNHYYEATFPDGTTREAWTYDRLLEKIEDEREIRAGRERFLSASEEHLLGYGGHDQYGVL